MSRVQRTIKSRWPLVILSNTLSNLYNILFCPCIMTIHMYVIVEYTRRFFSTAENVSWYSRTDDECCHWRRRWQPIRKPRQHFKLVTLYSIAECSEYEDIKLYLFTWTISIKKYHWLMVTVEKLSVLAPNNSLLGRSRLTYCVMHNFSADIG